MPAFLIKIFSLIDSAFNGRIRNFFILSFSTVQRKVCPPIHYQLIGRFTTRSPFLIQKSLQLQRRVLGLCTTTLSMITLPTLIHEFQVLNGKCYSSLFKAIFRKTTKIYGLTRQTLWTQCTNNWLSGVQWSSTSIKDLHK